MTITSDRFRSVLKKDPSSYKQRGCMDNKNNFKIMFHPTEFFKGVILSARGVQK